MQTVPKRSDVALEHTWDTNSMFASDADWISELVRVQATLPALSAYAGRLGDGPDTLLGWFGALEQAATAVNKLFIYAHTGHDVDTTNTDAAAIYDKANGLYGQFLSTVAFSEPELLSIEPATLDGWLAENDQLATYGHYFDSLRRRQTHVRSAEVEEVLGRVMEPFRSASSIHNTMADADLRFAPAQADDGSNREVMQGSINGLLIDPDREVRRTAWQNYADAFLAHKHSMAACLATGVKQDVFMARARRYDSSLEAALEPNHIPTVVFHRLIDTFRQNLPTWHRYWAIRRKALGYEQFHVYDVKAPLTSNGPSVPFATSVEWIGEGMRPLGDEYVDALKRGVLEERWVDIYPNQGKRFGAYSTGTKGTHPFILMSYQDDIFSMSTLAHELGHSLHSYLTWQNQPAAYSDYSLFVAEVASNFNQALVRNHLLQSNDDRDFQIAVIEEAMANFHRYFFVMPTLARFELAIHEQAERGDALTADGMIKLMADLFREGYGDGVVVDDDRVGITWAQFSTHLYSNFYVYQYATGISAAHALAEGVINGGPDAAANYLAFLRAGSSLYPLDALKLAGVDMTSTEPVEKAFAVLAGYVDRLETLLG